MVPLKRKFPSKAESALVLSGACSFAQAHEADTSMGTCDFMRRQVGVCDSRSITLSNTSHSYRAGLHVDSYKFDRLVK